MLVLSRKRGEKIIIADNIIVSVEDIDRGKVRIGIVAPKEVTIYRDELLPIVRAKPEPTAIDPDSVASI